MLDDQPYAWRVGGQWKRGTYGQIVRRLTEGLGGDPAAWLDNWHRSEFSADATRVLIVACRTAFDAPEPVPAVELVTLIRNFVTWCGQEQEAPAAIAAFEERRREEMRRGMARR